MPRQEKQYELLYRERQNSSPRYDKVIFVKSNTPLEKASAQRPKCRTDRRLLNSDRLTQNTDRHLQTTDRQHHSVCRVSTPNSDTKRTVKRKCDTARSKSRKQIPVPTTSDYVLLEGSFIPGNRIEELLGEVQPKQIEQDAPTCIQEIFQQETSPPLDPLSQMLVARRKAADRKLEADQKLIAKLASTAKISLETSIRQLKAVRELNRNEIIQIDRIRGLIQETTEKTALLVKKTVHCLEVTSRVDECSPNQIIALLKEVAENNDSSDDSEEEDQRHYPQARPISLRDTKSPVSSNQSPYREMGLGRQERRHQEPIAPRHQQIGQIKETGKNITLGQTPLIKQSQFQKSSKQSQEIESKNITAEQQNDFYENSHFLREFNDRMINNSPTLQEFRVQRLKQLIDTRIGQQVGVIPVKENQLDTSLVAIYNFISSFFNHYTHFNSQEFLQLINMPYGYPYLARLMLLQGRQLPTNESFYEDQNHERVYGVESVMSSSSFVHYYSQSKQCRSLYQKIHNQAVFEAFNEYLNLFRPYFMIGSPPYPWDPTTRALTYYFIVEENIQEIFQKTQFKVLKAASCLCGLLVEPFAQNKDQPSLLSASTLQSLLNGQSPHLHPLLAATRDKRLSDVIKHEINETQYQWELLEQWRTGVLIQVASLIFFELLNEVQRVVV